MDLPTVLMAIGACGPTTFGIYKYLAKRFDDRLNRLEVAMVKHIDQADENFKEMHQLVRTHIEDKDEHLGERTYDELTRRIDDQDKHRDRIERKLDAQGNKLDQIIWKLGRLNGGNDK